MLNVTDVTVTYQNAVRALRSVNISVPDSGVVAVLGSNGAGKTTLLRTISGTLRYQGGRVGTGSVTLDGTPLVGRDPAAIVRLGLVHVPEGRRIFQRLTVEENLRAGGAGVRDRAARNRARARVHEMFGIITERAHQRAGLLSGGEQQMLAIGRALMSNPRVLVLDEPSLGLAPKVVGQIGEILREINRQGTTIVLVEQNAALALSIADTAYVLDLGRVSLSGPAAELAASDAVARLYLPAGDTGDTDGTGERPPRTAVRGGEGGRRVDTEPSLGPWVPPQRPSGWPWRRGRSPRDGSGTKSLSDVRTHG